MKTLAEEEKGCYFCVKKDSCKHIERRKMETIEDFQYEDDDEVLKWFGNGCSEFATKHFIFR